jgi:hypothetical protein
MRDILDRLLGLLAPAPRPVPIPVRDTQRPHGPPR